MKKFIATSSCLSISVLTILFTNILFSIDIVCVSPLGKENNICINNINSFILLSYQDCNLLSTPKKVKICTHNKFWFFFWHFTFVRIHPHWWKNNTLQLFRRYRTYNFSNFSSYHHCHLNNMER